MLIENPAVPRLPTKEQCVQAFAEKGLQVADYNTDYPRYPCVHVLLTNGDLYYVDMLHGGGTMFASSDF